ncbi:hypothetical protein D6789_01330 [Candidatus Woesearchaeota archaeon]|nr:MAG: hypothetical protein D6789_01330 [Candidatus Woesearchaeota archaeon]
MFESYAKFYTIVVAALGLGFLGMELRSWTGSTNYGSHMVTGMVTTDAGHIIGIGGSELAFLVIGLVVGAAIVSAVYQAFRTE